MLFALVFGVLVTLAVGAPQFGLPLPKSPLPVVPAPVGNAPASGAGANPATLLTSGTDALAFTTKIQDLVELVRTTLTSMGDIAIEDNPEVGAKIAGILSGEIAKAAQILADYTASTLASGKVKREVKNGEAAYNSVGDVLVNSNDKIEPEKKKLKPESQKRINKKHKEGVSKCGADSCKAAALALQRAEDESERQR